MEEFDYKKRQQEMKEEYKKFILSNFSEDFEDKLRNRPLESHVFKALMNGASVYKILEDVMQIHFEISESFKKYVESGPSPIIMAVPNERFNEIKNGKI